MSNSSAKKTEDEYFVGRDTILSWFEKKPGVSTFYDWVNEGKVVKGPTKGFYKMNATRRRLGMPPIDIAEYRLQQQQVSAKAHKRRLHFLALTLAVPEALNVFSHEDMPESLSHVEVEEVRTMFNSHLQELADNGIEDAASRLAFVGGALKALDVN